jgi:DNA-binding MarR family transcriptional regulator
MTDTALLTGRDIGEAEGAMTALLERALAPRGRGRAEYLTLRVLATPPQRRDLAELIEFLARQPQVGMDRAGAATTVDRLRAEGLVAVTPDGVTLSTDGRAVLHDLADAVAPVTRQVFAGFDSNDLAVAHRVLVELTGRARSMLTAT